MFLLRTIRALVKGLTNETSPKQLALGVAIGLVIGLVPKGNLTALFLINVLCVLRVNLLTGMLAALLFSFVGIATDPLSHRIGLSLLTAESLQPVWTYLYDVPLVPWTNFNNTIVLGSFVLGLTLSYPAYRLSESLFARCTPRLRKLKAIQWLFGADSAERQDGE